MRRGWIPEGEATAPWRMPSALTFAAGRVRLQGDGAGFYNQFDFSAGFLVETSMGVKKTGKGRRKLGQKKRRMRARIRHRKG
jgi:hypothetical protein